MGKTAFRKVNFLIGLQYLVTRRKQSTLAALGVTLGVSTFIVMVSFMTGVNTFLNDAVLNGNPDIIISPRNDPESKGKSPVSNFLPEKKSKIEKILKGPENIQAFSPQIISPAILISETQQLPVGLNGVLPSYEKAMVDLDRRLIQGGGFEGLNDQKSILLGISLAKRLGVKSGASIRVILPTGKSIELIVSGIFSFGITTIDNLRAYVHAATLQGLLNSPDGVSNVHIKLKDRNELESIKSLLLQKVNGIEIQDWKANNKTIVIGNKVRNVLTWSISMALLLVAGFGIYNILNSTVIQKRKDIAVLKTMGYSTKDIVVIFLVQSFVIGFVGTVIGGLLGYLGSFLISSTPLETTDFIIVETYPVSFMPLHYFLGIGFGFLVAILAGYFPSKKASRVDPVTIIRGI